MQCSSDYYTTSLEEENTKLRALVLAQQRIIKQMHDDNQKTNISHKTYDYWDYWCNRCEGRPIEIEIDKLCQVCFWND